VATIKDAKYSGFPGFKELGIDFAKINLMIEMREAVVKKFDKMYVIFFATNSIDDLWKPEEFKSDEPVLLVIHTETYTRWTKENPKTPTEPTPLETAMVKWIETNWSAEIGAPFKGTLYLMSALAKSLNKVEGVKLFDDCEQLDNEELVTLKKQR